MSNVVQFLETLSLSTNRLTEEDYTEAVTNANFDPSTRDILLRRDASRLNSLLGGSSNVLAYIIPAEREEPEKEDEQPGNGDDDEGPEHVQEHSTLAA